MNVGVCVGTCRDSDCFVSAVVVDDSELVTFSARFFLTRNDVASTL